MKILSHPWYPLVGGGFNDCSTEGLSKRPREAKYPKAPISELELKKPFGWEMIHFQEATYCHTTSVDTKEDVNLERQWASGALGDQVRRRCRCAANNHGGLHVLSSYTLYPGDRPHLNVAGHFPVVVNTPDVLIWIKETSQSSCLTMTVRDNESHVKHDTIRGQDVR